MICGYRLRLPPPPPRALMWCIAPLGFPPSWQRSRACSEVATPIPAAGCDRPLAPAGGPQEAGSLCEWSIL
eukprot:2799722-Pyramimonas_sp.AAC.2